MRYNGRHYYFVCTCTVLFSLCSMRLTTTPRHSHFSPADFNAGGDRVVSQPGHLLSRVTFVADFLSHDGKYGSSLVTMANTGECFIPGNGHFVLHPFQFIIIRTFDGIQSVTVTFMGYSGVKVGWQSERGNMWLETSPSHRNLVCWGHLKGHIYETAVGTEEGLVATTLAACANY
jgi:hypothetical protein